MRHRSCRAFATLMVMALVATSMPGCHAEETPGERVAGRPSDGTLLDAIGEKFEHESSSDWQDFRITGREIWFHATHPSLKEGLGYAGLTLAALYLEQNKYALDGEVQEDRGHNSDSVASRVRPLGEAIIPAAALATWTIGRLSGSDRTRRVGLILSESAAFTSLATEVGQFVFSEQRPSDGGKLSFFSSGGHGISGHTSIVASISVPLDRLFFQVKPTDGGWMKTARYLGKGVVYAAPVITGWSRINDDKHYAWNVVLGLGVGFTVGRLVSEAHGLLGDDSDDRNWRLVPISDDHGSPGIGVRWSLH